MILWGRDAGTTNATGLKATAVIYSNEDLYTRWVDATDSNMTTAAPVCCYVATPQTEAQEVPKTTKGVSDDRRRPGSVIPVRQLKYDKRLPGRFRQRSRLNHRPRDER